VQLREGCWQGGGRTTRSSWMEREWRESAQIGWRRGRRCRSIGEGAGAWDWRAGTLDWSSRGASPLRIRGAAGHPPSPFPSVLLNLLPRQTHHGGRCRRADPARAAADSRAQNPPTRAVAADSRAAPRPLFSPARSPN